MRIALNGTGRIGRLVVRRMCNAPSRHGVLCAINSTMAPEQLAHLLKYDSVHGTWQAEVSPDEQGIRVNGRTIRVLSERNPERLPWRALDVGLVIDATGKFNNREGAAGHLSAGAGSVLLTAPAPDPDLTVVMGVNESLYDRERHRIVSAASCTTNCIAPVLKVLDDAYGVASGWMTTVHAFTNDQNHLDNSHKDLRRARSCTMSIIPTTTGVGKALRQVIPHLAPHITGLSIRVPTPDVSLLDLQVKLARKVALEEARELFREAVKGPIGQYIDYNELPLVSSDYRGSEKSAVVDGLSMMEQDGQLKLLAWYDNEWGYACRVADLAAYMAGVHTSGEEAEPLWKLRTV